MKSIAIFRHAASEGPGYLGDFLTAQGRSWTLIALDEGVSVPQSARDFAGLVFMGGPMSVNDDLPWIAPVLELIAQAVSLSIPVLGHCLGSQLMSKALGGSVSRQTDKEIGWGKINVLANEEARDWLGSDPFFTVFHWHGETWSLPTGATLLASSPHCPHQAFALGPHLGLQFHIEMTRALVHEWCRLGAVEILGSPGPAVQTSETILALSHQSLDILHQTADRIYSKWVSKLID